VETPDVEGRKLDLHVVLHIHGPKSDAKLGRLIFRSLENKAPPEREFLWLCSRKIPMPWVVDDDFDEDVVGQLRSYVRHELPRVTAQIKKTVASC